MPYGIIKVDQVTFTNAGADQTISVSGIVASISGNITATGTISGNVIRGGTLVSGATVTGTAGQFGTITGNTAGFTTVTGTTVTGTTAQFTTVTGGTAGFTTITGGTATITSGVFASGTAAAPSVSVGTTDNGIYSPGADQVAVATNGVQRINIEADGDINIDGGGVFYDATNNRLGIGTTSPSAPLHIIQGLGSSPIFALGESGSNIRYSIIQESGYTGISHGNTNIDLKYSTYLAGGTGGNIIFSTGVASATEKVRIDSSGRLLVGTSTARSNYFNAASTYTPQLQLEGTGAAGQTMLSITSSDTSLPSYLILARQKSGSIGGNTAVANNDYLGYIAFQGSDGNEFVAGAYITAEVDGTPGTNDLPTRLAFSTTADGASSPTERMRISSTGTHDLYGLNDTIYSRTNRGAGTSYVTFAGVHSATGSGTGTASCYIYSNGNIQNTNGSYTTLSDVKLKENIVDAGSQWDDLKSIQIRNWNFKAETGHETHRQIGPIAQELETVCPGLVFETPDRDVDGNETGEVTKGVNQSVLYMKAVKALQEAMERIEQLEAAVTALQQS
jgi:hypothetical protein